ncbi:hypothetical protein [Picrophilus oshimae]|uniref:Uncharacterized protein n=1 Tax=Picrophilus torridus (strain ATCC 700027 / DSM 9790 / JCM 10055 / NBRC 100828 / KAW 2/3) TaxID=1122961 RepID=Q6L2D2_PICTO|nr:hypothetical protein [Picrophilus oshimae]AAT42870.1 hypothetical protein PTO0285 [Picrophilus oshimae DSM 9789]SMD31631.1 hypothetical protein SAMN02745355_1590 [Picrophilus oshimae DSM 9789]
MWDKICAIVLIDGNILIKKPFPSPQDELPFKRSIGEIKGQIADYRLSIENSNLGIHAVEFIDRYEVHVDLFDPYKNPLKHIIFESPGSILDALFIIKNIGKLF